MFYLVPQMTFVECQPLLCWHSTEVICAYHIQIIEETGLTARIHSRSVESVQCVRNLCPRPIAHQFQRDWQA